MFSTNMEWIIYERALSFWILNHKTSFQQREFSSNLINYLHLAY